LLIQKSKPINVWGVIGVMRTLQEGCSGRTTEKLATILLITRYCAVLLPTSRILRPVIKLNTMDMASNPQERGPHQWFVQFAGSTHVFEELNGLTGSALLHRLQNTLFDGKNIRRTCSPSSSPPGLALYHEGRLVPACASLPYRWGDSSTRLDVVVRLVGGGGDGGATGAESRSSFLDMYKQKKVGELDKKEERMARWTRCSLSLTELQQPVCADELGNLYNKEAVLNALITKAVPPSLSHLSLRTIFDLKLTPRDDGVPHGEKGGRGRGGGKGSGNGVRTQGEASDAHVGRSAFVCPVTGVEMNGGVRFVAFRRTGHVFSEKAVKEVKEMVEDLIQGKVSDEEIIPLNGSEDEVNALKEKLALKLSGIQARKAKKDQKKKKQQKGGGGGEDLGPKDAGVTKKTTTTTTTTPGYRAVDHVPEGATKEVWASLFVGSCPEKEYQKESFLNRGTTRGL